MRRRDMLRMAAVGAAGLAVRGTARAQSCPPRGMDASRWGELPAGLEWPERDPTSGWSIPSHAGVRGYKVLEIFLVGGCSVWDSFAAHLGAWELLQHEDRAGCGVTRAGRDSRVQFMTRAGRPWLFAPAIRPLDIALPEGRYGRRADGRPRRLFEHLRVLPVRHEDDGHELAIPHSLAGHRPGNPGLTSPGSAIARRYGETAVARSWVVAPFFPERAMQHADAIGRLPGWTRPIVVGLDGVRELEARMRRDHFSGAALNAREHDRLLAAYREQYRGAATPPGCPDPLRSAGLSAYENAADAAPRAVALAPLFAGATVAMNLPSSGAPFCRSLSEYDTPDGPVGGDGAVARRSDGPLVGLDLAARLLADSDARVRHVLAFDTGVVHRQSGQPAYDSHNFLLDDLHNNLHATMSKLAAMIENETLDLTTTLVVINTEFGRTAALQGNFEGVPGGRAHNGRASFTVMLGGPTRGPYAYGDFEHGTGAGGLPSNAGTARGFVAAPGGATSSEQALWPVDVRAAVLTAAGVNPADLFERSERGPQARRPSVAMDGNSDASFITNVRNAAFWAVG